MDGTEGFHLCCYRFKLYFDWTPSTRKPPNLVSPFFLSCGWSCNQLAFLWFLLKWRYDRCLVWLFVSNTYIWICLFCSYCICLVLFGVWCVYVCVYMIFVLLCWFCLHFGVLFIGICKDREWVYFPNSDNHIVKMSDCYWYIRCQFPFCTAKYLARVS